MSAGRDCECGQPAHVHEIEITLHRTELIPGGGGARVGFSDDFPGKQFLIIPAMSGTDQETRND